MDNRHKSNRLSSLFSFGHSRGDSASSLLQSSSASHPLDVSQDHEPDSPPSRHQLYKSNPSAASSLPALDTLANMSLTPPPVIGTDGLRRPSSAAGQRSAYSSGQASREEGRSRPATPVLLTPHDTLSSSRPQTPTSAKPSKRRSWLPGRADKGHAGQEQHIPQAWIAGLKEHIPYNLAPLIKGEQVSCVAFLCHELSC